MANDLKMEVILQAIDRATRPIRAITQGSVGLGRTLKESRDQLKALQAQQSDISSFRALKTQTEQTGQALQASRDKVRQLSREMQDHQRTIAPLQASYNAVAAQSDKLGTEHKALTQQLRQTRQESRAANQAWQQNRQRIRELGQQLGNTATPTKKLRDEYAALVAKQKDQLALVRTLTDRQKTLTQQHRESAANTRQHKERVGELSAQLREAQAPLQGLNRAFRDGVREANALKAKHGEQQRELQGLRTKLNAAGISTRNLSTHERELRNRVEHTNKSIADQTKRMQALAQQSKRLAQARAQYDKTQQLAGSMAGSGAAGLASGSGILYGLRTALAPGMEFDATMSRVQALTNLDKGDEQLAALRAQARKLGAETMFNAGDAASGQAFLAMAGFTPKAIMAAMPGLLDMAKAGDMDLGRTADIASNILGGFRLDAGQMSNVADILTKAFTTSNTSLEMLGETMKYVGPVAASAGMGLEEAAAMAGLLGNVGIQSTQAGTTLRAMLLRLAAPLGPAQKAMDKLGISAKDSEGNLRGITTVLGEVAKATEKMGNGDRLEYLKAIFGEEPAAGMAELIQQAGAGGILKYLDVIQDHAGAAGRTAKVLADNLTGDLDELFSGLDEVRIELFDQQNSGLREFVQGLTEMVGRLGAWTRENPKLTGQILKMAAGLGLIMATMGGLTLMLASILGPFAMVRYGMMLLGIKSLGAVTALKAVGSVLVWIGRALMLNPIGLAISALAAAALIYENWDQIVPFFQSLWSRVAAGIAGLWSEIKAGFSGGFSGIAALILNFSPLGLFYRAFASVMSYFGVEMPTKFSEFGSNIIQGLITGVTSMFPKLTSAIGGIAESVVTKFKGLLGIHSPSRVFAELGDFTMQGLEKGLLSGQSGPLGAVLGLGKQLAAAGAISFGAADSAIAMDNRPPLGSQSAPRAAQVQPLPPIHINVHPAPGMDEQQLARLVATEVAKIQRAQQARGRSALSDQE